MRSSKFFLKRVDTYSSDVWCMWFILFLVLFFITVYRFMENARICRDEVRECVSRGIFSESECRRFCVINVPSRGREE